MKVNVIDAVMGTGKSTWISLSIKANPEQRYIVILPLLSELARYEEILKGEKGLVCLLDGDNKKERFDSALDGARIIITTHALFENNLDATSFQLIKEGNWHLVMDEVIKAFEPASIKDVDIVGLEKYLAVKPIQITPYLELLLPVEYFTEANGKPENINTWPKHKIFQNKLLRCDTFGVSKSKDAVSSFYTYWLKEDRLRSFDEVTILTYPFKDTDLDYWFQIKGVDVDHLKLSKGSATGSLSDFCLVPHDGEYSGKDFKHLVEFLEPAVKWGKMHHGDGVSHFSSTDMAKTFLPNANDKRAHGKRTEVTNTLRGIFRNKTKYKLFVEPRDFMFTCKKDCIPAFQNSKNLLSSEFIGEDTFVPFNERATNGRAGKHYLCYLYNAYPFPGVEATVGVHKIKYNRDRYALYVLIQWIWRSAIRKGEKIYIYLPSKRMRNIFEDWLNA